MRVLVTRPLEDAKETARLLEAMGHEAVIAPLLEIRFHDGPLISLEGVQAILATSANGVRALARRTSERSLPVFCAGPQTAEAAREAGFTEIKSADGDAKALAACVTQWASPGVGLLLHAAGQEAEGKLRSDLTRAGFSVRRETLYEAAALAQLPDAAIEVLRTSNLDTALFSRRAVRRFFVNASSMRASPRKRLRSLPAASARTQPMRFFYPFEKFILPNSRTSRRCWIVFGKNRFDLGFISNISTGGCKTTQFFANISALEPLFAPPPAARVGLEANGR